MKKYNFNYGELVNNYASDIYEEWVLQDETYDNLYDFIVEWLDSELIYYEDQWELLKEYYTPTDENISYGDAFYNLVTDCYEIINNWLPIELDEKWE